MPLAVIPNKSVRGLNIGIERSHLVNHEGDRLGDTYFSYLQNARIALQHRGLYVLAKDVCKYCDKEKR